MKTLRPPWQMNRCPIAKNREGITEANVTFMNNLLAKSGKASGIGHGELAFLGRQVLKFCMPCRRYKQCAGSDLLAVREHAVAVLAGVVGKNTNANFIRRCLKAVWGAKRAHKLGVYEAWARTIAESEAQRVLDGDACIVPEPKVKETIQKNQVLEEAKRDGLLSKLNESEMEFLRTSIPVEDLRYVLTHSDNPEAIRDTVHNRKEDHDTQRRRSVFAEGSHIPYTAARKSNDLFDRHHPWRAFSPKNDSWRKGRHGGI
jgi:hypothetical protein